MTSTAIPSSGPSDAGGTVSIYSTPAGIDVSTGPAEAEVDAFSAGVDADVKTLCVWVDVPGTAAGISLDRLTDAERTELENYVTARGGEVNLSALAREEQNDPEDVKMRALVCKMLGNKSLAWPKGAKLNVTAGNFLLNYKVNDNDRKQVLEKKKTVTGKDLTKELKNEILNRYAGARDLLEFSKDYLKGRAEALKKELDQLPAPPPEVKSRLRKRLDSVNLQLKYYTGEGLSQDEKHAHMIKESAVLNEALHPLDAEGLTDTQINDAVKAKKEWVKGSIDSHCSHSWKTYFSGSPEHEHRDDREREWFAIIPTRGGSKFEAQREAFAADISRVGIEPIDKTKQRYSSESLFMELSKLTATGPDKDKLESTILNKALFNKAFNALDDEERTLAQAALCQRAGKVWDASRTAGSIPDNADAEALGKAHDDAFKAALA